MSTEVEFERLGAELERRYGAPFMQDITDQLLRRQARGERSRHLLVMKCILSRSRGQLRDLVRQYRTVKMEYRLALREGGARADRFYFGYEEEFLRRQLKDSIQLYLKANRDYHAVRRLDLERLFPVGSSSTRAAAG